MLPDFGWSELLMIGIVLIVVIGPKDLPRVVKGFSKGLKNMRKMSDDFRKQFSDALDEADMTEMRELARDVKSLDPRTQIKDALAPLGKVGADLTDDIKKATEELEAPSVHPVPEFKPAFDREPSAAEKALTASSDKAKAAQPAPKKAAAKATTQTSPDAEPGDAAPKTSTAAKKPAAKKPAASKASAKSTAQKATTKKTASTKTASDAKATTTPVSKAKTAAASKAKTTPASKTAPASKTTRASKAKTKPAAKPDEQA